MMNHISILLPVNRTNANSTWRICVAPPPCTHCRNTRYFVDLQQLFRCSLSLTDKKNVSNQGTTMPHAVLVRWENRVIHH